MSLGTSTSLDVTAGYDARFMFRQPDTSAFLTILQFMLEMEKEEN